MLGAEVIKLNETTVSSRNSEMNGLEMAIWETFSGRCYGLQIQQKLPEGARDRGEGGSRAEPC